MAPWKLAAILLVTASITRCGAAGGPPEGATDRARFLRAHPGAKVLEWPGPEGHYAVMDGHSPEEAIPGLPTERAIAVFDAAGRRLYERAVTNRKDNYPLCSLWWPSILAVPGRVLAFGANTAGPWGGVTHLVMVGFKAGQAREIELERSAGGQGPVDFYERTWLEDIDGDGKAEICRFVRSPFICRRWDEEKGEWRFLPEFMGKRIGVNDAPVRWHVATKVEEAKRTMDLRLDITSLVDRPLILSQQLKPLFADEQPGVDFPGPIVVRYEQRERPPKVAVLCKVRPSGAAAKSLTIPPLGTRSLSFTVELPAARTSVPWDDLDLSGRAQWGAFEGNYSRRFSVPVGSEATRVEPGRDWIPMHQALLGSVSQEEIDKYLMRRLPDSVALPMHYAGTAVRRWLLAKVRSSEFPDSFLLKLHVDMADEAGYLALEALKKDRPADLRILREMVLLALRRRDPGEYRAILQKAGGAKAGLEPTLLSLLKHPVTSADYPYRVEYLDAMALARALADWPDAKVAAEAKSVLAKPREEPDRVKVP